MKLLAWFAAALVAANACGAFERPGPGERARALGNLFEEPANVRPLLTPDDNFPPIPRPGPHDWLTLHEEAGQSFDEFRDSEFNRPDSTRHVIYLQPIGSFFADPGPALEDIRAYAADFFQLEVKILPGYQPGDTEFNRRLNPRSKHLQILTTSVMDFLKTRLPADGYCVLGVTTEDIYPEVSWNYVFGQALFRERVGVYSFARYDPEFWGDERPRDYRELVLQRSCKVLAHEIGHMCGLPHCTYYSCVMNGGNHLVEADACPQHLCPVCLRKLHHVLGFDLVKRYEQLGQFYHLHHWDDDSDWIKRQLARADPGKPAVDQPK